MGLQGLPIQLPTTQQAKNLIIQEQYQPKLRQISNEQNDKNSDGH